jgi:hypothetical protein
MPKVSPAPMIKDFGGSCLSKVKSMGVLPHRLSANNSGGNRYAGTASVAQVMRQNPLAQPLPAMSVNTARQPTCIVRQPRTGRKGLWPAFGVLSTTIEVALESPWQAHS